eukprot:COSAG05_NODE_1229_length_5448_cov_26.241167_1_plen_65_part_10
MQIAIQGQPCAVRRLYLGTSICMLCSAPAPASVREPPSEVLISDPKVNQPKQARRPRMRIQRAHD